METDVVKVQVVAEMPISDEAKAVLKAAGIETLDALRGAGFSGVAALADLPKRARVYLNRVIASLAEPAWLFSPRCPRCLLTNTRATSTRGNVQFRVCSTPVCSREPFKVIGTPA